MGQLFEMPSVPNLPKNEINEEIKQTIFFEFQDMEKRAEAMKIINELRQTDMELFGDLQSVKVDTERTNQGLEFAFSTNMNGRDQEILEHLHQKGIKLNIVNGVEEKPYIKAA